MDADARTWWARPGLEIREGRLLVAGRDAPEVREGDVVAMLNVGSYNQSMHMDHCLRPAATVVAFPDRVPG